MTETVQKIKFKGLDFILTTPDEDDSPIATIETYKKGECSYAHLFRNNGKIMRFCNKIGTVEDIEFGEFVEIEIDTEEAFMGLFGDSWSS